MNSALELTLRAEEGQARVAEQDAVSFLELRKPVLSEQRPHRNLRATCTQPVRRSPMPRWVPLGAGHD
jgi:hypothetical protein